MKLYEYEGKNLEELKEKALTELNANEDELYIRESEEAGGLFKAKKYKLTIATKDDVVKYVKDYIVDIAKYMGISVKIEAKKREEESAFLRQQNENLEKFLKSIDQTKN